MTIINILAVGLVVLIFVAVLMAVGIYNRLIALKNRFKNAWAQIDVQLKRRNDLIPNLVETAKGYLSHERETLEAVLKARSQAVSAGARAAAHPENAENISMLSNAESVLGGALGRLMAVVENYPELKANETMSKLMEELSSTENRISFARQAFNDSVMTYNTTRESFPNVLFVGIFNFQQAELFSIDNPAEREVPKISFER